MITFHFLSSKHSTDGYIWEIHAQKSLEANWQSTGRADALPYAILHPALAMVSFGEKFRLGDPEVGTLDPKTYFILISNK